MHQESTAHAFGRDRKTFCGERKNCASAGNGKIALRAVVTDAAGSAKDFIGGEIKKCNGKVTVAAEDDSLYETLTFETGGEKS